MTVHYQDATVTLHDPIAYTRAAGEDLGLFDLEGEATA